MISAILVAGGAGYIGSHVCKVLAGAGFLPVTLDNLCTGYRDFVRFGPLVEASVEDEAAVRETVIKYDIAAVIDLAGSIEIAQSVAQPLLYYENNFVAKVTFLRTLSQLGVRAIVISSSASVYGETEVSSIAESHALLPQHPYGRCKLMYEQLLADIHRSGGPRWMGLRYFNAAGASPDGDIGEAHEPETHLIARACLASLGLVQPLSVFGSDYPTPDGTAIRDYVHVMDIASAHVLALHALLGEADCTSFNLGTGTGTSVAQVLAHFQQLGIAVPHHFRPRRTGDPSRLVADASAIQCALGWQPFYSDMQTIIRSAHSWHLLNAEKKELLQARRLSV